MIILRIQIEIVVQLTEVKSVEVNFSFQRRERERMLSSFQKC